MLLLLFFCITVALVLLFVAAGAQQIIVAFLLMLLFVAAGAQCIIVALVLQQIAAEEAQRFPQRGVEEFILLLHAYVEDKILSV